MPKPMRSLSASALDLGVGNPQADQLNLDMDEEMKKRKRLLDQSRASGPMSAAYMSLTGNQY